MARRAAGASEAHVAQAARDALSRGNAVDAVVTGVLVAAAEAPGVLLGPLQVLVGGAGAGLLAIDGRVRQPGLGAPRPRGVLPGERVPAQARVGVPALPATLATILASLGSVTLLRAAGPGLELVRARSAERAALLHAFARRGATALTDGGIAVELQSVAGRAAGGALTVDDLVAVRPVVMPCEERSLEPAGLLRIPWSTRGLDGASTHVVAAADARGLVALACYETPLEGLPVPGLGLLAPAFAAPVMRGQTRIRPGEPRPAAAPIALRTRLGMVDLALGLAVATDVDASLDALLVAIESAATLTVALDAVPSGRPVVVVRTREAALVVASA
ncbi:MAG TPA: hypothetical protein VIF15_18560 [Polyangiaceae bacterium]